MRARNRSAGFTLIELLIVIIIVGLLASMAMVGYQNARVRGREAAAIAALTAINQAQFAFMQSCGRHRYAPTLVSLGKPVPGSDQAFISPDLATADPLQKSGYLFVLSGTPSTEGEPSCHGDVPLQSYRLTADPMHTDDGSKFFGTNTDRVVYQDAVSYANDMSETGAPGHGAEIK